MSSHDGGELVAPPLKNSHSRDTSFFRRVFSALRKLIFVRLPSVGKIGPLAGSALSPAGARLIARIGSLRCGKGIEVAETRKAHARASKEASRLSARCGLPLVA